MLSHDFNDEGKTLSRIYNLTQVKGCGRLYDRRVGKLVYDWVELAGCPAHGLDYLRDQGVLGQHRRGVSKFIGLDNDRETYDQLCERYGQQSDDHVFKYCTIEKWLRKGRPTERVGVVNYDTTYLSTGGEFQDFLPTLVSFARKQASKLGNFALILNVGLDRGATLEDVCSLIERSGGTPPTQEHLELPGVRYYHHKRKSDRINYCMRFGPIRMQLEEYDAQEKERVEPCPESLGDHARTLHGRRDL